jgi:hypothetical protein
MTSNGTSRDLVKPLALLLGCAVAGTLCCTGNAQVTTFPDRGTLQQVLGSTWALDDFSGYSYGVIGSGTQLGDFIYTYSTNFTIPAILPNGDYKLLGAAPYKVFVGGDRFILTSTNNVPMNAFGMDISYAPAADTIPANTFNITIRDGPAAGLSVGNPPLPSAGGSFFLGFIANPGIQFTSARFIVVQTDPNVIVPASQINDVIYRNGTTPALYYSYVEPVGSSTLFLQGGGGLPGGRFVLFSTTNLSFPLSRWSVAMTNYFDSSGNFALIQSMNKTNFPRMFFLLKPN